MQPWEIIRRDRFLKPRNPQFGKGLGLRERLLSTVGAVGIDEEFDVWADGMAGGTHPGNVVFRMRANFHLYPADPLRRPASKLLLEPLDGIRSEAATAV